MQVKRGFSKNISSHRRGQISLTVVLMILSLMALAGLAIDAGRLYSFWNGLSRSLDAACAAASKKAQQGASDLEIMDIVNKVARLNLAAQWFDLGRVSINTTVAHNPAFANLIKINVFGRVTNIPLPLMKLVEGLGLSQISSSSKCPTCYNNPQSFSVPGDNYYDGGLACQRACNDGTYTIPGTVGACCAFMHGWMTGQNQNTCVCSTSAAREMNTDNCDPEAQGPQAVNPAEPGISGPVWINRTDENTLANACRTECIARGQSEGILWCNEGCREEEGTVCCKCHCLGDPIC